jgi:3'-phosphoadenosine 5'-phosphosulfate sulfotransferase (PAPS reductase)/FAD synthetase
MTKLLICMSGGRTSAFMTKKILDKYTDQYEIVVCFANTGQENNATLDFVKECDDRFGFNTVWIEAKVNDGRVGSTHRIVNYETASRDGKPFKDVVAKYGIPNISYPHCTRELKNNPVHSYIKSIGWKKGEYETALGIRSDEPKRISTVETNMNRVYPLVNWFSSDKQDVMSFWSEQEFDLQIQDYQGNCKWCYKKSTKKLLQIMDDDITIFDFPNMLEEKYGQVGNNKIKGVLTNKPRSLFRQYHTTKTLIKLFNETNYKRLNFTFDDHEQEGCAESCEAFVNN